MEHSTLFKILLFQMWSLQLGKPKLTITCPEKATFVILQPSDWKLNYLTFQYFYLSIVCLTERNKMHVVQSFILSQLGNAYWTLRGAYQTLCVYCRVDKITIRNVMKCQSSKKAANAQSFVGFFLLIYHADWMHLDVKAILYCIC